MEVVANSNVVASPQDFKRSEPKAEDNKNEGTLALLTKSARKKLRRKMRLQAAALSELEQVKSAQLVTSSEAQRDAPKLDETANDAGEVVGEVVENRRENGLDSGETLVQEVSPVPTIELNMEVASADTIDPQRPIVIASQVEILQQIQTGSVSNNCEGGYFGELSKSGNWGSECKASDTIKTEAEVIKVEGEVELSKPAVPSESRAETKIETPSSTSATKAVPPPPRRRNKRSPQGCLPDENKRSSGLSQDKPIFSGTIPLFTLGVDEVYPYSTHVPHNLTTVDDQGEEFIELAPNPHALSADYRRSVLQQIVQVLPYANTVIDLFASSRDVGFINNMPGETQVYYACASIDSKDFLNRVPNLRNAYRKKGEIAPVNNLRDVIDLIIEKRPSVIYMNDVYQVFQLSVEYFTKVLLHELDRPEAAGNLSLKDRILAANEGCFPVIIWVGHLFPVAYGKFCADGFYYESAPGVVTTHPHASASPADVYTHCRAFNLDCQIRAMHHMSPLGSVLFFPSCNDAAMTIESIARKERICLGFGVGNFQDLYAPRYNRAMQLLSVRQGSTKVSLYNSVSTVVKNSQAHDEVLVAILSQGNTDHIGTFCDKMLTKAIYEFLDKRDKELANGIPEFSVVDTSWKTWLQAKASHLGIAAGGVASMLALKNAMSRFLGLGMVTINLLGRGFWVDMFLVVATSLGEELVKFGLARMLRKLFKTLSKAVFGDNVFKEVCLYLGTSDVSVTWYFANLGYALFEAVVWLLVGQPWYIPLLNHFGFGVIRNVFGPWAPIFMHLLFDICFYLEVSTSLPFTLVYCYVVVYGYYLECYYPEMLNDVKNGNFILQPITMLKEAVVDAYKLLSYAINPKNSVSEFVHSREQEVVPLEEFKNEQGIGSLSSFLERTDDRMLSLPEHSVSAKQITQIFDVPREIRLYGVPNNDLAKVVALETRVFKYQGKDVCNNTLKSLSSIYLDRIVNCVKTQFAIDKEALQDLPQEEFLALTLAKLKPQRKGQYQHFISSMDVESLERLKFFDAPKDAKYERTMFIKTNERLGVNHESHGIKPRTIVCCEPWLNLMYAPYFDRLHKQLKSGVVVFTGPNVEGEPSLIHGIYAAGLRTEELNRMFNEVLEVATKFFMVAGDDLLLGILIGKQWVLVEGDATAFDATQGKFLLNKEMMIYRDLGIDISPLAISTYAEIKIDLDSGPYKFKRTCRSSGFPNTSLGNSLIQGLVAFSCLWRLDISASHLCDLENIRSNIVTCFEDFGIRLKVPIITTCFERASFLRGFFYFEETKGCYRWAPALGRLMKLQSTFADLGSLYPDKPDLRRRFLQDVLFSMQGMDWPQSFTIFDDIHTSGGSEMLKELGYLPGYFTEMLDGTAHRYSEDVVVNRYGTIISLTKIEDLLLSEMSEHDMITIFLKDYS